MLLDLETVLVVRPQVLHIEMVIVLCTEDDTGLFEDLGLFGNLLCRAQFGLFLLGALFIYLA
jgi:hypothetical protein